MAPQSFYPCLFLLVAMVLSCSRGNTPVQAGKIVGKWQRVDQPSVSLSFQKDGGFSAEVAGTRVLAGRYQLLDGTRLVLVCDAASFKASRVTNQVALVRGQLNIGTPDGRTEKYKRAK